MTLRTLTATLLCASLLHAGQASKGFGTYGAKELRRSDVWINSKPLTLKSLNGKVVVIDFWAFDCEPCIETMPHIIDLYDKYAKDGLVVIGVHTPRIDIEHNVSKLREAVVKLGIQFPVVVDDNEKMFRDYLCDLWPSQFVIDQQGIVRYSHGGVGRYQEMEEAIQKLLSTGSSPQSGR
jgi:thiol-disulfide isomerase/thioredoxin